MTSATATPEVLPALHEQPTQPPNVAAALALRQEQAALAMPLLSGDQMVTAFQAYVDLQRKLDAAMPDAIMELDGKPYRRKTYWRAIAVAFGLTVEPTEERREVAGTFEDGRENFGYIVTYRATTRSGRYEVGDGACFAVEKAKRFKCQHEDPNRSGWKLHYPAESCPDFDPNFQWHACPPQATEHNIRSHAHTRAFNRAVSNLVGFGEVSAEEVARDEAAPRDETRDVSPAPKDGKLYVVKVEEKTGTNKKGTPWTRYAITFSDGKTASTFDEAIGAQARSLKQRGAPAAAVLEKDGKYTNITELSEARDQAAPPPLNGTAPPAADVKEMVVAVRSIPRPNQTPVYGIKGTSGQPECYTDDQTVAAAAEEAASRGVPVMLRTEQRQGTDQKQYRWLVEVVAVAT